MDFERYKALLKEVSFGKKLPDSIYIHQSLLGELPADLKGLVGAVANALKIADDEWDVLKLFKSQFRISYLSYPDFFDDSYPALSKSINVDLAKLSQRVTDYSEYDNPPILHRKETMLSPAHPRYVEFQKITNDGEELGLYENTRVIGFREGWLNVIRSKGYELVDGALVAKDTGDAIASAGSEANIDRYKTAIVRHELSSPMKALAKHGYLDGSYSVFDYGCGRGDDITELQAHGIDAMGWDPVHRPDSDKSVADIVNLGFVVNVIEDADERLEALCSAWALSEKLLVVSVMLGSDSIISQFKPYKDGVITSRNTFQKYYAQNEIKAYLERSLDEMPIALAPGIFLVFKDKLEEQRFLANKYARHYSWEQRTKPSTPDRDDKDKLVVASNQELFDGFWLTCLELGRLPSPTEFSRSNEVREKVGSLRRAFSALKDLNGDDVWQDAQWRRKEDLLLYLAMTLFEKRKPYASLDEKLKRDVKALFGDYKSALGIAKDMLFLIADTEAVTEACVEVSASLDAGHLVEAHSLQFRAEQLNNLPLLLRLYVGAGLQMYGEVDELDLIKIHMTSGKLTLLVFDDFEQSIPFLVERVKIKMAEQDIDFFDYIDPSKRPPLLNKHRYMFKDETHYEKQRRFDIRLNKLVGPLEEEHIQRVQFNEAIKGYSIKNFTIRKTEAACQ